MDGGIEEPAREGVAHRRIGRAVVEDMIDPGEEETVDGFFDVGVGAEEMLVQPGDGLGGGKALTGDMSSGGSEFIPEDILSFRFGDIAGRIQVEDIGRRAMGLVSNEGAFCMGPVMPGFSELFEEQIGDGLAIVAEDTAVVLLCVPGKEGGKMQFKMVAASLTECR